MVELSGDSKVQSTKVSVTFADDIEELVERQDSYQIPPMENRQNQNRSATPDSDGEDYSVSVNAIIQRRASTRRSKKRRDSRRASSPFSPDVLPSSGNDRRRSSVFTTSSGDTAITVEDTIAPEVSQDQIFENIKLHEEVLQNVKMQPWDMRKKMKLVLQAKAYIKRHEGALQERLAQNGSTRDRLARCYIYFLKKWQNLRREISNILNWFIPWEQKVKEIESHFGSVVASYFLFIRWLFWVNIVIAGILVCFVAIPELFTANPDDAGHRKKIPLGERYSSTNFLTLWDFKGFFEVSPLFYGWYTNNDTDKRKYRLPLAYFITGLMVYAYSFFATLRKMAENSKMSKLCEKDDECIFSWKLFTAWDHMIGSSEAAHNRVASILMGFKEALLEEAEKKKEARNWKITGARILVNIVILGLFFLSAGSVVFLVHRSVMPDGQTTFWRRNELTIVMTLISIVFPMLFDAMGFFEQYHPRKQLRIQLARIMALNLLNLYSLIFSQFDKIHDISDEMTNYLMELSSQSDIGRMKKNLIEKFPDISPGKTIYCYQTCHWNVTPSSLLVGALILNSSISPPTSVINDITSNSSSKSNWSISMINQSIDQNDYPSYDDYFTLDVKNHPESSPNSSLKSSPQNEGAIFSTGSYDTEATWRDKSPDYLSFILSEFDSMENNSQSTFLNRENISEISTPDNISKESITTTSEFDFALKDNSTAISEYFYEYTSNDSSFSTADSGFPFTNIIVDTAEPDSSFEEIINKSSVLDYEFEKNSSTSSYDYTFQDNGTTTSESISSSTSVLDIIIENDSIDTVESSSLFEDNKSTISDSTFDDYRTTTETLFDVTKLTTIGKMTPGLSKTDFPKSYTSEPSNEVTQHSENTQYSTIPSEINKKCTSQDASDHEKIICEWSCDKDESINMTEVGLLIRGMNNSERQKLRTLCWETMFGQELVKLTVMDLIMTFLSTMALDFFRGIFIRLMNGCWCWDLEKDFPKYSDFKVAENILHLVNNQGMIWMGLFFSPGLALINVVKLFFLMYLRAWTVVTCNVPPEVIFRASKSNNFYYALLLMMLFLCVLPVGYAIVWIEPSWYCGPFSGYKRIYHILTETVTKNTPPPFDKALAYIVSPGIIIPLLVLLILFIYYLTSLTSSLREANSELKFQLRRERTEERRKLFQMVDRRKHADSFGSCDPNNPFHKWKKLLRNLPATKSMDDPSRLESFDSSQQNSDSVKDGKDRFSKLIKSNFLAKLTNTHNDDSDTEQADSLPHDVEKNVDTDILGAISNRRKNSSTSYNLKKIISAFKSDKIKKENADKTKFEDEDRDKDDFNQRFRKQSSGNEESLTAVDDLRRQESVSSNRSDNIPVITISKTESSESILNASDDKLNENPIDTYYVNDSFTSSAPDKFKPIIRYALKKQTKEVDEDSIRHFPKEVMKQRSQTMHHDSF